MLFVSFYGGRSVRLIVAFANRHSPYSRAVPYVAVTAEIPGLVQGLGEQSELESAGRLPPGENPSYGSEESPFERPVIDVS